MDQPFLDPTASAPEDKPSQDNEELNKHKSRCRRQHETSVVRLFEQLLDGNHEAAPDERAALRLAAGMLTLLDQVQSAELLLGARLEPLLEHPKLLAATTQALRDCVGIHAALARNATDALTAARTLRSQRQLAGTRGKESWHGVDWGSHQRPTGRDTDRRHPVAN